MRQPVHLFQLSDNVRRERSRVCPTRSLALGPVAHELVKDVLGGLRLSGPRVSAHHHALAVARHPQLPVHMGRHPEDVGRLAWTNPEVLVLVVELSQEKADGLQPLHSSWRHVKSTASPQDHLNDNDVSDKNRNTQTASHNNKIHKIMQQTTKTNDNNIYQNNKIATTTKNSRTTNQNNKNKTTPGTIDQINK